jgi:dolichol kinase
MRGDLPLGVWDVLRYGFEVYKLFQMQINLLIFHTILCAFYLNSFTFNVKSNKLEKKKYHRQAFFLSSLINKICVEKQ